VALAQDGGVDVDVHRAIVAKASRTAQQRYALLESSIGRVVILVILEAADGGICFEPGIVVVAPAVAAAIEPVVCLRARHGGWLAFAEDLIANVAAADGAAEVIARADAHPRTVAGPQHARLRLDLHLVFRLLVHLDTELRQRLHVPVSPLSNADG